jgi:transposase
VAVTVQDADEGDTTTMRATLISAAEQLEAVLPAADVLRELVTDKGFHGNDGLVDLAAIGIRTYISEPDRGRRCWRNNAEARAAVYANRRRIRRPRGLRLLRRRGEYLERTFAHTYDTGGMRRTHLRGHHNILKRLLVHVSGFNLGLLMRTLVGVGTPRGLQGRLAALIAALWVLVHAVRSSRTGLTRLCRAHPTRLNLTTWLRLSETATCTTGC